LRIVSIKLEVLVSCSVSRIPREDCLDPTCLKWASDGSLSNLDQRNLLLRLCNSDLEFKKSGLCVVHELIEIEELWVSSASLSSDVAFISLVFV